MAQKVTVIQRIVGKMFPYSRNRGIFLRLAGNYSKQTGNDSTRVSAAASKPERRPLGIQSALSKESGLM